MVILVTWVIAILIIYMGFLACLDPILNRRGINVGYRETIPNNALARPPTLDDILTVLISTDCGDTYNVAALINGENHTATAEFTTFAIPLEDFAGDPIKIRFTAQWGAGDYWLDIDNIFIPRCVGTLGLEADVTDELDPVS